ncbi:MAG: divergent polysaccharide deacetylase family protein, partial [Candidatus Cloacimonadaceae bacterium]
RNHIFLDAPNTSDATMDAKIKQLQSMSQSNPNLIAITHCHSRDKLAYLQKFIQRITKAGFTLVPLSKSGRYYVPKII